jgi:glycosyltransferase involved in cell wall biosynthesis
MEAAEMSATLTFNGFDPARSAARGDSRDVALSVAHVPRRFAADHWGGTETAILQTCRQLKRRGHDNRIVTTTALCETRAEEMHGIAIRRHRYSYPFWGLDADARRELDRKGGNLLSLPLFRDLMQQPELDVLHAHSGKRLGGLVRTVARLRRVPYLISLHGGAADVPSGEMDEMLKPLRGTFEWGRAVGALIGARRVLHDADAIICVGDNERRAVQAKFPGKRVEWMPNGVDAARFVFGCGERFRQKHAIPADRNIVLCVGRIDYQKNQLALLESLSGLLRHRRDLQLVLIGPVTSGAYGERLRTRIEQVGLERHVTIIPGLPADSPELLDAYQAASVFCLPSLHEPFGIVVLEAWAAGLPVVASRVGGIPGFTRDGIDVLHAEPERPDSFGTAISSLLDDTELRARLSGNGRVRAQTEFDWSRVTDRLEALYRDLVGA